MKFKINLSGFSFTRPHKTHPGERLRFSMTWWLEREDGTKDMWMHIKGCIAYISNTNGELKWNPPKSGQGAFSYENIEVSPELYQRVRDIIAESKYMEVLGEHFVKVRGTEGLPQELENES